MAFDFTQPLFVAGIAAISATLGYLGKRIISNEKEREQATLFNSHVQIAASLKAQGLTTEDADNIATFLKNKRRQSKSDIAFNKEDNDERQSFTSYWTQAAMNLRAGASANIADAQLQAQIIELNSLMSEDETEAFNASQNAWENYVEKQVDFAGSQVSGGSMESLIRSSERENLSQQRSKTIKSFIEQLKDR